MVSGNCREVLIQPIGHITLVGAVAAGAVIGSFAIAAHVAGTAMAPALLIGGIAAASLFGFSAAVATLAQCSNDATAAVLLGVIQAFTVGAGALAVVMTATGLGLFGPGLAPLIPIALVLVCHVIACSILLPLGPLSGPIYRGS